MNGVNCGISDQRGPSLLDFDAWEDVDVIYQSPSLSQKEEASYILMGEDHTRSLARIHHSSILDQQVIPDSLLLVEGFKALIEVTGENRQKVCRLLQISKYAQEKIKIIGWDWLNHLDESQEAVYLCKVDENSGTTSIERDEESIFPLGEKFATLQEVEFFLNELPQEYRLLVNETVQEGRKKYHEELAETFPIRTATMNYTLKKVEELRLQGKILGKIFLVGGLKHLREEVDQGDIRFSLNSFYQTLQELPAVVLASKVVDRQKDNFEEMLENLNKLCDSQKL